MSGTEGELAVVPNSHIVQALQLNADGYVYLFKITLNSGGTIYLVADQTVTWNGEIWQGVAIKQSGVGSYGDDQVSRPKLQVQNIDGAFTVFVSEGAFDLATVTRYRVLYQDILENNPVYLSQMWQVSRIASVTKTAIGLELQDMTDIPHFLIPARTFSPPDFPVVTI